MALHDDEGHTALKTEHHDAALRAIRAGRAEALRLYASGTIHDEVLRSIERELDLQQVAAEAQRGYVVIFQYRIGA